MRILAVTREKVNVDVVSPGSALTFTGVDMIVIDPKTVENLSHDERDAMIDWLDTIRCRLMPVAKPRRLRVLGATQW
jgi:hypothetical protein